MGSGVNCSDRTAEPFLLLRPGGVTWRTCGARSLPSMGNLRWLYQTPRSPGMKYSIMRQIPGVLMICAKILELANPILKGRKSRVMTWNERTTYPGLECPAHGFRRGSEALAHSLYHY